MLQKAQRQSARDKVVKARKTVVMHNTALDVESVASSTANVKLSGIISAMVLDSVRIDQSLSNLLDGQGQLNDLWKRFAPRADSAEEIQEAYAKRLLNMSNAMSSRDIELVKTHTSSQRQPQLGRNWNEEVWG